MSFSSKIFVIPSSFEHIKCVQLKHPKCPKFMCTYYLTNNSVFELSVQKNEYNSWFAGNSLVQGLFILSIVDIIICFILS